ncbi:hypothetical protein J5N97_024521 [Dioscorea zingiberensis]|uniref:Uncharacterized protein n=1 Tax=Dioscorea zingiberensis TaxID=325984 RepID=A0A9D5C7L2_9LILI|nr:hypothetical protein J5N97_024521 [Dioscorea zingiberensis]
MKIRRSMMRMRIRRYEREEEIRKVQEKRTRMRIRRSRVANGECLQQTTSNQDPSSSEVCSPFIDLQNLGFVWTEWLFPKNQILPGLKKDMSFVVVISLPLVLLVAIIAIACYLLGRAKARCETHRAAPFYGPPAPPPPVIAQDKV